MQPKDYRNVVFPMDVLAVLREMPDDSMDMVYGDPDYNVGVNYAGRKFTKTWDEYIAWYGELARECMRVLKPDGNLFLLNYPRQNAHLRVLHLEELAHDIWDYAWVYNSNIGHSKRRLTTAHRSLLHATKSKNNKFYKSQIAVPYQNPTDRRIRQRIADGHKGRMPYSWFYYDLVKNVSKDKTIHACQIPLGLVEMLIKATTRKGDDVFVLFGGSGSELCLTQEMGRNFVSCEINRRYHDMILDRLQNNGHVRSKYKLPCARKNDGAPNIKPARNARRKRTSPQNNELELI